MCMQTVYKNLPEDLQRLVDRHRYNNVVAQLEQEFRSWQHFAVMDELTTYTYECGLWEEPTIKLVSLVNEDRHCVQQGHTDFEKYIDPRQVLLRQYEDDDYEFGVSCRGCVEDGAFPCRGCSEGPLRRWVEEGCFPCHNFRGWPVEG